MLRLLQKFLVRHIVPRGLVLVMDLFVTAISFVLAYLLRFNLDPAVVDIQRATSHFLVALPVYIGAFLFFGSFSGIIRHTTIQDAVKLVLAMSTGVTTLLFLSTAARTFPDMKFLVIPYSVILIHYFTTTVLLVGSRMAVKGTYQYCFLPSSPLKRVMLFGAGELGLITLNVLEQDHISGYKVVGFIDDKRTLNGKTLNGIPIYSARQAFRRVVKAEQVQEIIISINQPNISPTRKKELLEMCLDNNIQLKQIPAVNDWMNGQLNSKQIRNVMIADLLSREAIHLEIDKIKEGLKDSIILITGAAGSIGSEIVRQLMAFDIRHAILYDQAETPLYDLQNELKVKFPKTSFDLIIGDVRDPFRLYQVFNKYQPDIVFNAAAYKHVPLMEAHPYEAIRVNIGGTLLLADLSVQFKVKKFVMLSTDKAVNPTNVMGASKRICEIYIQALSQKEGITTQFITTRFGNVLGSNGSVVPLFQKQIEEGGPVTVTHPDITRFFMTIPEACQLVLEAGFMGKGGEIYVFDMGKPVKIYDLAKRMISLSGFVPEQDIAIKFTGLRPGEKLYEELLANKENTLPTHHPKIMIAQVRKYPYDEVNESIRGLLAAVQLEDEEKLVNRMKLLVPEFISQNSRFTKFDKEQPVGPRLEKSKRKSKKKIPIT
ncbi:nucleoside-diphosphate sugar epimerase/dehydratase [Prolixibacter sp. NT017]|uniref:polysaccharide biosynthesis protein n=1 Tax=Prolixibacter sp. NT017 TaxID=2652390 RepID=UPI00127E0297|nr:nucleoside-diphosphate sugar epimerase/dehydratase [Prolixibacter sp. NT017]GET24680.1 capsular polysaccharide biosynthesis protein [Prolixibacter sp. NT017]